MAFRINTNIDSLETQKNLAITNSTLSSSIEKLSSNRRIGKQDDAAGLAIALSVNVGNNSPSATSVSISDQAKAASAISEQLKSLHSSNQFGSSTLSNDQAKAISEQLKSLLSISQDSLSSSNTAQSDANSSTDAKAPSTLLSQIEQQAPVSDIVEAVAPKSANAPLSLLSGLE